MRLNGVHAVIAVALAASLSAPASDAADSPRFEITPFAGYRTGGSFDYGPSVNPTDAQSGSVDVGDDASYGIDLGLYRDEYSFYEFLYSRQGASLDSKLPELDNLDVTIEYYQFGGTAMFPDVSDKVLPYLSLTAGATRFSADKVDSDTKFSMSLGGGLRVPFGKNVAAIVGLRGYLTFVDTNTEFLCVSNGGDAGCLLKSSGSTFFQAEAQLGLSMRF